MRKAVVIVSGGMDSVTVLYYVVREYGRENVKALSFNYGSKHNDREIPLASYHCNKLGVGHEVINLDFSLFQSNLLKVGLNGQDIPEGYYTEDNMKKTVVPFRNGIMLSMAVGYAESLGYNDILLGSHRGDRSIYPDCRVEFTSAMNTVAILGTYNQIRIISPYNDLTKGEIVAEGLKMDVDYSKTWSCYKGEERPCGRCGTCVERTEAFILNKKVDPSYSSQEEWNKAVKYWEEVKKEI